MRRWTTKRSLIFPYCHISMSYQTVRILSKMSKVKGELRKNLRLWSVHRGRNRKFLFKCPRWSGRIIMTEADGRMGYFRFALRRSATSFFNCAIWPCRAFFVAFCSVSSFCMTLCSTPPCCCAASNCSVNIPLRSVSSFHFARAAWSFASASRRACAFFGLAAGPR